MGRLARWSIAEYREDAFAGGVVATHHHEKDGHTQGVRTQVLVAAHALPVRLVEGRVARYVLRVLSLLVAAGSPSPSSATTAAAAEHLVEETELRRRL